MTIIAQPKQFAPSRYIWRGPDLSEARSLDANCYTSEAFFQAEIWRDDLVHTFDQWVLNRLPAEACTA